ncbi:MAG: DUF2804 domain-containing protein [Clostridia bacterium]|nr:DUF2804 domain-containing protein [Clostridia bacterium]
MQHLLSAGDLLDKEGNLAEAGYAYSLVRVYDRSAIKASKLRIKEWDYYYVTDGKVFFCVTVADIGYISMASVSIVDCERRVFKTASAIGLLPLGKLKLPSTYERGDASIKVGKRNIRIVNDGESRRIICDYPAFHDGKTLKADITLTKPLKENMVIATPFDKRGRFYYNAKLNCMSAQGSFTYGDNTYSFSPDTSVAGLDWGRGVWTYSNTWYWSSLSCIIDGERVGFNLGYGFGNTSAASENMLFVGDKAHKLGRVDFGISGDAEGKPDFLSPWHFTDDEGRLDLIFKPDVDRRDRVSLGIITTDQHQVFGRFYGTAVCDDGSTITFDGQRGFAEKVFNAW